MGKLHSTRATLFWVFAPLAGWAAASRIPALHEFHFVLRASCEFISGSALFALYANAGAVIAGAQKHLDKTAALFLAVSLLLPVLPSDAARSLVSLLLLLAAPVLIAGLTGESSLTARWLSTRPLLWLASISYGLFLSHDIAERFLHIVLPSSRFASSPFMVRYLVAAAYLIVVLVSAIALHRLVELPCSKALNSFSFTRRPIISKGGVCVARPVPAETMTKRAF